MREFLRLQRDARPVSGLGRFLGVDPLDRDAVSAYVGALAELRVSDTLDALGDEWSVVDAVSIGPDEPPVDHILFGPAGVFSIGLRNHAHERVWVGERTFIVDGHRLPHIRDAEHEADLVAERMSAAAGFAVEVTPCLVLAAPGELTLRSGPRRVEILLPDQFAGWLAARPTLLSPETVVFHRSLALAPGTWAGEREPGQDTVRLLADFVGVDSRIRRARRIRVGWAISGAILGQVLLVGSALAAHLAFR